MSHVILLIHRYNRILNFETKKFQKQNVEKNGQTVKKVRKNKTHNINSNNSNNKNKKKNKKERKLAPKLLFPQCLY